MHIYFPALDQLAVKPSISHSILTHFNFSIDKHKREMTELREELRKLKEEKLDSKLKIFHRAVDHDSPISNGMFLTSLFKCTILNKVH